MLTLFSLSLLDFSPAAIPEFAYRKVYLTGEFDHDHEILLGPKTRDGELGYHVITPLLRGPGQDTILVNRGFVKRVKKDRSERPDSEVRLPIVCGGSTVKLMPGQRNRQEAQYRSSAC